tara:strand:- start:9420 stop:10430 length:1011 start_codon:yes stop_codon:yes gene_type:complete
MKTNKYIKILLDNGLGIKTISNLKESQIRVLAEKFEKEESKEQVTKKVATTYEISPQTAKTTGADIGNVNIKVDPTGMVKATEIGEDAKLDVVNDPDATEDGMQTTEGEMNEKFKSTAQQKFFWNKCTKSGDKKSRWCKWANEFQKDTKDKNLPEKLHPEKTVKVRKENYERFLENSIVEMVDKYINPGMTKSQLINRITEKVNKSESFMLKRPKKNTMFSKEEGNEMKTMKRPIGRMSSLGEDTKEKERTKTKEKEKDKERKNPFAPKYNPKPKAKKEFKEQEIAPSKPGTKEKTREKEPGKKNPFAPKYNPAPKAGKGNMPNWLVWNKLGVNLK